MTNSERKRDESVDSDVRTKKAAEPDEDGLRERDVETDTYDAFEKVPATPRNGVPASRPAPA